MCSRLQKLLLCGGPSGRGAHHDQTCNSHGPRTSRALEQSARDTTCSYGTVDIVLTTNAVDGSVDKVVDQSDDASRVAEEGPRRVTWLRTALSRRRKVGLSTPRGRKKPSLAPRRPPRARPER